MKRKLYVVEEVVIYEYIETKLSLHLLHIQIKVEISTVNSCTMYFLAKSLVLTQ
jgi:hypothetical protein